MRNMNRLAMGIVIGCLFFLSLQSVVYADSITNNELLSQLKNQISQLDKEINQVDRDNQKQPLWFPGFLIVQIIKGIIAFILIILILLDVIEPSS